MPLEKLAGYVDIEFEIHRPGEPVAEVDVVLESITATDLRRVTWPEAPGWEPHEGPPVGRIVRVGGRNCFPA